MNPILNALGTEEESRYEFARLGTSELTESYALRYQVYCWEAKLLSPSKYPDGLERDRYDPNSIHIGAFDEAGRMVGTVRLVQSRTLDLPLFEHCMPEDVRLPLSSPMKIAEVSRLAVAKNCLSAGHDGGVAADRAARGPLPRPRPDEHASRRSRYELVMGLYKGVYQESKRHGIEHWVAAMEASLGRLLQRFHFGFEKAGAPFDYYGEVLPFVSGVGAFERQAAAACPTLLAEFARGLPPDLYPDALMPRFAFTTDQGHIAKVKGIALPNMGSGPGSVKEAPERGYFAYRKAMA